VPSRCLRNHLAVAAALLLLTATLFGQGSSGSISGRVVDPTGAAIAGAEVHLINQVDRQTRTFTTTQSGDFAFPAIEPGDYTLSLKLQGFKQYEKKDVHLAANASLSAGDLKLEVGAVSETVEVTAQGAVVETASGDRTSVLDSKQITDLMARGRDVMSLLQVLPGVVNDNTGSDTLGQFTTPTMDGTRAEYNSLNIDGISGNTARGKNAQSPINMDAIETVTVLTNSYTAKYGTASGGVINLVTKSGTQRFHGGAYYYNRNEAFNANDFFNNRGGIARQRYRYNTEGANLGGPIFWPHHFNADKQKLFFFISQEYLPNQSPNSANQYTMPTALERKGDFSQSYKNATTLFTVKDPLTGAAFPGNVIPASRIDPNSAKLLSIFPLPNATNTAITKYAYNYQIADTEDVPVKQEILKVDYNVTSKAKAWFRASGYSSDSTGLNSAAIQNKWLVPVDYAQTMPNLGANLSYVFSPTLINEATIGMNLWTEQQKLSAASLAAYQRTTYGINIPQTYPADNPLGLIPAMTFAGSGGISKPVAVSYDGRFPMVDDSTAFSFSDGLTKVWNSHTFEAGLHWERALYNQYHQAGGNSFPGAFAFDIDANNPNDSGYAFANAYLGNFDTYKEATNRVDYAPITRIWEWYVQDHWKITSRLTLDIGIRFTDSLPQEPNNNNAGNFVPYTFNPAQAPTLFRPVLLNGQKVTINPLTGATVLPVYAGLIVPNSGSTTNGIVTPTTAGFPRSMVFSNGILPAPRFGLAWDPFGDGKTAVRMAGGIFYAGHPDAGTLGNLFFNPPAIYTPTQYYGQVATAANGTGLLSPSTFSRDIDPHAKNVTSYHASFNIQREIGRGTVVDVGYVGSFGRHLGQKWDLNTVPYGAEFLPQNQNPQTNTPLNDNYFRPYMGYGSIPQQIFDGNSSYHSLQVQANRRFTKGLQFGVVYTFSKAMNYSEGDSTTSGGVAQFVDRKVWNYGLAGYDRPNVLTFHFLWDVPRLSRVLPNSFVRTVFDGWQISDITSFISGKMLAVSMGASPSVNFTGGGDGARPLMVGDPNLSKDQRTFDQYFNVAAFAEPTPIKPSSCTAAGCPPITIANIGNMPSTVVRGPGVNNWNTSIFKNFVVKERFQCQFRAEAYNTFNHSQFDGVDTTITYNAAGVNTRTSSGQINSSRDPRIMQFALRIRF
jgi:outer membrane receptor protein involved in Fe transport